MDKFIIYWRFKEALFKGLFVQEGGFSGLRRLTSAVNGIY